MRAQYEGYISHTTATSKRALRVLYIGREKEYFNLIKKRLKEEQRFVIFIKYYWRN
jgi:hypothetical protein